MRYINSVLTAWFDFLLTNLNFLGPLWALCIVSMLAGIVMLLIFRLTSNQSRIKEAKNKMQAHLIEILLFKDSPRIILSAQKRLLLYNAQYMKHALKPMLYMILPVSLMLIQLDGWFGYRPLNIGESAIVSVKLSEDGPKTLSNVSIDVDKGLIVETPPLRIPENGEINWRVRADTPGEHIITVNASGHATRKKVEVFQTKLTRLSRVMVGSNFWDILMNPGEGPIKENSFISKIGVGYPTRKIAIFGWQSNWLLLFFILSIAGGFAFRKIMKTEI